MSIRNKIIATIIGLSLVAMLIPSGVAQAALTESQIQSILSLLTSFGADATTVANVDASLRGTTPIIPTPPTGIPAGFTFTKTLKMGDVDQDVVYLKIVLASDGCLTGVTNTTLFGSKTKAGVQCFQQKYGTGSLGTTGVNTRAKLNALIAGGVVIPIIPTGAGLTVALAADNPASGTLVSGTHVSSAPSQAGADLAHITFINGDNAEVKVTNLKLKRIGVGADATLANVYLYDGAVRLTDAASVSSTIITFNDSTGLFKVSAGGSKTIRVLSDIALSSTGQTLGISVVAAADVTSNASSVKGSFPVSGNLHTTATATLAGVSFGTTTTPSGTPTVDPQNDYAVWTNTATIMTRAVNITRFTIRQTGSVLPADLQNLRLYISGAQVGSAVANVDANGYATFDFSASPVKIETGAREIKVLADIVGGSNKNFIFSLRASADASFVDTQVGVATIIQANSIAFSARTTGTVTVNPGTITISKTSDSPSGNIVDGAPSVTLAKFTVKAAGEKVKIETLDVAVVVSTAAVAYLRNGALYANGVQIGSTSNLYDTTSTSPYYTQFSLGSALIVDPLSPVTLEVKADIYDNDGTNDIVSGSTIQARIAADTSNAEGQVSKTSVDVPASNVDGNSLTVAAGGLTLSKYTAYTNKTVVAPLTAYKLAHFTLTANTTEAVNVNTIVADLTTLASYTSNLYVKFGNNTTSVKASPSATAGANSWSVNYLLPVGTTVDVMVYGDVNSYKTGSTTGLASVKVSGVTASSATAVCAGDTSVCTTYVVLAGQTITFSTGSINAAVDGTTPQNQSMAGNQQVTTGKFKFTASNDNYTVTEAKFTVQGTNGNVITLATLKDGSTVLGTPVPYDSTNNWFYFTGLNVSVAANTTKVLTLDLSLVIPYTDGTAATTTTGQNVAVTLSYIKTLDNSGVMHDAGSGTLSSTSSTVTIASSTTGTSAANYVYVYKTVPTFTVGTVPSTQNLSSGTTTSLYSFTVSAPVSGPVSLRQLKFPIAITDNNTGTVARLGTFKFFQGSTDLTQQGVAGIVNASGTDLQSTTSITTSGTAVVILYPEEVIPAGLTRTYTLKATPVGFSCASGTCDSASTSLSNDSTPAGVSAGADTARFYLDATANMTAVIALQTSAAGVGTGTAANVIWSDNSAKSHNDTYTGSTSDWFNGYLINNLPLDSIGVSAQ